MVDQPRDALGRFLPFDDLNAEAARLDKVVGGLTAKVVDFRKETVSAGTEGASAFKKQSSEAKGFGLSLGSITKAFQTQFALSRVLRTGFRDVKKGITELVDGAVAFGRVRESVFNANSFNNLLSTLKRGFAEALGVGGGGLFSAIEGLLDQLGTLVRSDSFVRAIQLIDDGLAAAAEQARKVVADLEPGQLLQIAAAIGNTVQVVASILGPVITGFVAGFADLAGILNGLVGLGRKIFGDDIAVNLKLLAEILTLLASMKLAFAAIGAVVSTLGVPVLLFLAGLAAVAALVAVIDSELGGKDGLSVKFETIARLISIDMVKGIERVEVAIEHLQTLLGLLPKLETLFTNPGAASFNDAAKAINDALAAKKAIDDVDASHKLARAEIMDQNGSAKTFLQAVGDAVDKPLGKVKDAIKEFAGDIPELRKLMTQEIEPINIPVEVGTPRGAGQGGGVNPGIGDAIAADITKSINSLKPVVDGFGQILADTITDALDPNRPGRKSLKQRFSDFFKSLPLLLLQSFAGGGGAGGAIGKASGGRVGWGGVASLAHFTNPQGFAGGGRPAGLHSSDTVPIWAGVNEWVIKARSALMYGGDVMAAINAGAVDPLALRALAGGLRLPVPAPRRGFATGGPVSSGSGGGGTTVLPVLSVDRRMAEQIFAAATENGVFADHLAKNASAARTIFGR